MIYFWVMQNKESYVALERDEGVYDLKGVMFYSGLNYSLKAQISAEECLVTHKHRHIQPLLKKQKSPRLVHCSPRIGRAGGRQTHS